MQPIAYNTEILAQILNPTQLKKWQAAHKKKVKVNDELKTFREEQRRAEVKKKLEEKMLKRQSQSSRHGNTQPKHEQRKYKTIAVDTTKLISVKIDNKTTVLVKPGTNIEAVKMQYKKLRHDQKRFTGD